MQEINDSPKSSRINLTNDVNVDDEAQEIINSSGLIRFVALFFICFLSFGSYFCYDNPAALEDHIRRDLNITLTDYVMLYSVYSWPNVILCFLGGFLIDRVFGVRLGSNIYTIITLIGQLIFALGALCNLFWIMILGRFIFGIGAESLAVAQNNYAVLWFKGKELNMVFGLQLSFARIGSAVNFLVMTFVYDWVHQTYQGYKGLGIVLFIASTSCLFSVICSLILGLMDRRASLSRTHNEASNHEVIRISDVKDFKSPFWLITIICVSYYVAIFPFIGLAKDFLMNKFHLPSNEANDINSVIYFLSAGVSPILGLCVDKFGKNISWIIMAVMLTIVSHGILTFTYLNPYIGMVFLGISYSLLASSLWPLVSLIIPEHQLGTAYGVCQSVQNLGLAIFSILTGLIVDHFGYTMVEIFFISSLIFSLAITFVLWFVNKNQNGTLNMTTRQRYQQIILSQSIEEQSVIPNEAIGNSSTSSSKD